MGDWAGRIDLPDDSADVIVSFWSGFRSASIDELQEADRVLRHDGRLLVVHDYGRDDVSRLRGDLPEYGTWSRRNGWFLKNGFRIRVVHCFWTFDSMDAAASFLVDTFGPVGIGGGRDVEATPPDLQHRDLPPRQRWRTGRAPPPAE